MTNAKRGSGSHRWVFLSVAVALGFALSACGGGGGGSGTAATSSAASTTATASTTAAASATAATADAASNLPTPSTNAVTINWMPPTENTDGTPLTDLSGYDIYYGTSSGNYTQTITVSNPGIATYVVDNLSPGTYYFSVAAVGSDGAQSPLAPEISATVN